MQLIIAITVAIFIFIWQKSLYNRMWDEGLKVDIRFKDSYINAGEGSSLYEVINNNKLLPLPVFHVKFSVDKSFLFDNHPNFTAFCSKSQYRVLQFLIIFLCNFQKTR